jgi:hypothetical protein
MQSFRPVAPQATELLWIAGSEAAAGEGLLRAGGVQGRVVVVPAA